MTVKSERHQGALGRGLASLIPTRSAATPSSIEIPLARIQPNPYQPRRRIDDASLDELVASVRTHGIIQPILVTELVDGYQLVAGERRFRAAQRAGLDRIPAVIRQLASRDQLELALVENLQRADLDAIEEAHAYRQLIDEFSFTQEQLGERLGRARSTIANTLRLLDLNVEIQTAISEGRITEGHARAMAGLSDTAQHQLIEAIVGRDLSVRQTEELARRMRDGQTSPAARQPRVVDADVERVEEELRQALGTKVSLARSRRGGRIVIEYYSDEDLGRLYERLVGGVA
ncbi:MAG TPA: ParB/RepB/Spo0J family partition protein [Candidatus Saccharimonadales bacterium]|nr:ParB/RepB/Spo0J family partition protein [Candidatus Saccharimonadales bacterium]